MARRYRSGADGRPQPFQVTMRRFGRKLDVASARASMPLRPFFFDCLWLDGEDLTLAPATSGSPRSAQLCHRSRSYPAR